MPLKLEENTHATIKTAKGEGDGAESLVSRIKKMFHSQHKSLFDVVDRFQGGLKAHQVETPAGLLAKYGSLGG